MSKYDLLLIDADDQHISMVVQACQWYYCQKLRRKFIKEKYGGRGVFKVVSTGAYTTGDVFVWE